ncbi:hypothetical protein BH23ACT10_BH23ACT10_14800 [soil metagenome]
MATTHDWMREHGAATRYRVGSLAAFAVRVREGDDFRFVLREFLDDVNLAVAVRPRDLLGMIEEAPGQLEQQRQHAFLGALAEHIAMVHGLAYPRWAAADDRFLAAWWFPVDNAAYDAIAIRESPPAFRRRAIFLPASLLERV